MGLILYYIAMSINVVLCWTSIAKSHRAWRFAWLALLLLAALLPFLTSFNVALYYGLVINVSLFAWSSDTFMMKGIRRIRGIIGGLLTLPLPYLFPDLFESIFALILATTVGHFILSGLSWPIVIKVLANMFPRQETQV